MASRCVTRSSWFWMLPNRLPEKKPPPCIQRRAGRVCGVDVVLLGRKMARVMGPRGPAMERSSCEMGWAPRMSLIAGTGFWRIEGIRAGVMLMGKLSSARALPSSSSYAGLGSVDFIGISRLHALYVVVAASASYGNSPVYIYVGKG
jgi:hypothetical protein